METTGFFLIETDFLLSDLIQEEFYDTNMKMTVCKQFTIYMREQSPTVMIIEIILHKSLTKMHILM